MCRPFLKLTEVPPRVLVCRAERKAMPTTADLREPVLIGESVVVVDRPSYLHAPQSVDSPGAGALSHEDGVLSPAPSTSGRIGDRSDLVPSALAFPAVRHRPWHFCGTGLNA